MKHYRWLVIALAFLATIINYMDRSALSYAIGPLKELFKLNNANFGVLASSFGVGYVVMTLIGGIWVDKFGARKVWTWAAIVWSISCALIGFASGFIMLFLFRLLMGLAEGPAFPAMTRTAADWLPMSERAKAFAFSLAAVPLASVVGAPLISHLILSYGWRIMFVVLGVFGIIWAIVWHVLFRDKPEQSRHVTPAELAHIHSEPEMRASHHSTSWRFILLSPSLLANNFAFFSFGYLLFFALNWLPGYFEQTAGINLHEIGVFLIAPWLLGAALIILCGIVSDRIWKHTKSIRASRTHFIWICQILSAVCFIPATFTADANLKLLFVTLGLGIGLMPNATFYAINADLAKDRAATSLGVMDAAFALAGILSPLITGFLANATGNFHIAIYVMSFLSFSSAILVFCFQHPDRELKRITSPLS